VTLRNDCRHASNYLIDASTTVLQLRSSRTVIISCHAASWHCHVNHFDHLNEPRQPRSLFRVTMNCVKSLLIEIKSIQAIMFSIMTTTYTTTHLTTAAVWPLSAAERPTLSTLAGRVAISILLYERQKAQLTLRFESIVRKHHCPLQSCRLILSSSGSSFNQKPASRL
jgi:hypothetical protein